MSDPLRIDIPLILPEVTDAADRCVERLLAELSGREGVERVHVLPATASAPAQLCLHFDQSALSLQRIRELVNAAGAKVASRFGHAGWKVDVAHARRARTLTDLLQSIPGVLEANVSAAGLARVEFDRSITSEETIKREFEKRTGGTAGEPPAGDRGDRRHHLLDPAHAAGTPGALPSSPPH